MVLMEAYCVLLSVEVYKRLFTKCKMFMNLNHTMNAFDIGSEQPNCIFCNLYFVVIGCHVL